MGINSSQAGGAAVPVKRIHVNIKKPNPTESSKEHIVQNFILIWLDSNITIADKECQYAINELQQIGSCFTTCTTSDQCKRFIDKIHDEQIFLVVSGRIGRDFVPIIHENKLIDSIYVFCGNEAAQDWTKKWKKIKLISNQIERIGQALSADVVQCDHDLIPTSILTLDDNLTTNFERIDHSFMYSQLLKEILLDMVYDNEAHNILVKFCQEHFKNNEKELKRINEFKKDYPRPSPIWWYTREAFAYRMLNHSLRILEIDTIAMMGFFMKDVHDQIKKLYLQNSNKQEKFTVYRGQRMSTEEFDRIVKNINGLITFNSFLSTSTDVETATKFSRNKCEQSNKVPILFQMKIDPTQMKTPFTTVKGIGCYDNKEEEILFSMHTIFRIKSVEKDKDENWKIKLESVGDDDLQITKLTEQIRRELGEDSAVHRLCRLMIILNEFDRAEVLLNVLWQSTPSTDRQALARIFCQQGYIKYKIHKYNEALQLYEEACRIQENLKPRPDLELAMTYENLGLFHTNKDPSKALDYHKKALEIRQRCLHPKHPNLATSYNNIGLIYDQFGEFQTALIYYEKTMAIYRDSLPPNHHWLATLLKNAALAEASLKQYDSALNHLQQALNIRNIVFPKNHPSIASIHVIMGDVYLQKGDYQLAITSYDETIQISLINACNPNYSEIALVYYNQSKAYNHLRQHQQAIKCAEQAVHFANKISTSLNSDDLLKYKKHLDSFF